MMKEKQSPAVSALVKVVLPSIQIVAEVIAIYQFFSKNDYIWLSIAIILFLLLVFTFINSKKIGDWFIYLLMNATSLKKDYLMLSKKSSYEFIDRQHMKHQKTFKIKVLQKTFNEVYDKFSWSGGHNLAISSNATPVYGINNLDSRYGMQRYKIYLYNTERIVKGQVLDFSVKIDDIVDETKKSSPYLSSGVYEKTKELILEVILNANLEIDNIQYTTYLHYTDDFCYHKVEVAGPSYDNNMRKNVLRWKIKNPIYGAKYVISWDFVEQS